MNDDSEDAGCLGCVGILCVSIAAGCLWGSGYGWLAFGVACLLIAMFGKVMR